MGIKDIKKMNVSLLCKWWWKIETEEGLWQSIISYKYLRGKTFIQYATSRMILLCGKTYLRSHVYLQGRHVVVGSGDNTSLWRDAWLADKPLMESYPDLFKLFEDPNITFQKAKENLVAIPFSRWLVSGLRNERIQIWNSLSSLILSATEDRVKWRFGTSGRFSVKSAYSAMTRSDVGLYHKMI